MNHASPSRIQVLVAHPDPLLALGLTAALGQARGIEVLCPGADGRRPAADVVLTDYAGGFALASGATGMRGGPQAARILVLAAQEREQEVRTALERGVHGYLLAGSRIEEVVDGVRAVALGQRYLSQAAAQCMADSMAREHLTGRETDVLGLLVQGCCNKTIARQLDIAVGTVKAHVKGIMSKLHARSRTQVVSIAVMRGLVKQAPPAAFLAAGLASLPLGTQPGAARH